MNTIKIMLKFVSLQNMTSLPQKLSNWNNLELNITFSYMCMTIKVIDDKFYV